MSQTVSGIYTTGVTLSGNPATIATGSTISGTASSAAGVYGPAGTAWTLTNQGLVSETGANSHGVSFVSSGTIINTGSGTITGAGSGIQLAAGGLVTNQSGGTISGNTGIYALVDPATIVNVGLISGNPNTTADAGVLLAAGGSVTNQSSGTISGYFGIWGKNVAFTVVNAGTIAGDTAAAPSSGVLLNQNGSVTNQAGGVISGFNGVYDNLGTATVVNAGTIEGLGTRASYGIEFSANTGGGNVTNQSGGVISGINGVEITDLAVLVNAGTITGNATTGEGVEFGTGGIITNQAGGAISGAFGVRVVGAAGTVVNAGSIIGGKFAALYLTKGGSVTNQSGGVISGKYGVEDTGSALTVVNAGTIAGTTDAVKFVTGFANRLIIDPDAVFTGTVTGGNAIGAAHVSTLELASAGSAGTLSLGTLSGLGTQFIDFAQVVVDAGAQWALQATDTIKSGVTLTNAGTLSGTVTMAAGGVLSNTSTGTVTASGGAAVFGETGGTAKVVNAGLISVNPATVGYSGVSLAAGGSVTNQAGGTISGYQGIYDSGAALTVVNAGSIAGYVPNEFGIAVVLRAGGSVTNQSGGSIRGYDGIAGYTAAVTVVNAGTIAASGNGDGVLLDAGGSVTNQGGGSISGKDGIDGEIAAATVVNAGSIAADGNYNGVFLDAGGSVTNQSGGTISGTDGIYGNRPLTVVNAGNIAASATSHYAAGVRLHAGGSVTNQSGGTISGRNGIAAYNAAVTVVNAGDIAGKADDAAGIAIDDGGSVTNRSGGTISGLQGIDGRYAAVTVVNAGTITGYTAGGPGIDLEAGGSVTNQSSGTIAGYVGAAGIEFGGAAIVVNAGLIAGAGYAVQLAVGGSVTNQIGGTISGGADGIGGSGSDATVVNAGSIAGATDGILLSAGGSVTNQSGGTISGASGIYGDAGAVTVVNDGTIVGHRQGVFGFGVRLNAGGSITNQSAGTISGNDGIYGKGGVTVVNAGTITGTSYAVEFVGGYANRLIADSGAVFAGTVQGGGGVLELASAASAGTLSGLGTSITNFGSLQFDAGAAWTVSGNDSASGLGTIAITGFTYGDTIDLTGFIEDSDTIVNTNTLVLTDSVGDQATLNIVGSFTAGSFQFYNDGNAGTDVVVCFAAGTLIDTPAGEVQVEKLNVGELVMTAHNGPRSVRWIGKGKVLSTPNRRTAATPVIVRKGALGPNMPHQDLRVTKAHSLYIDEVLIPVEFLVNYKTIIWDDRAQEVEIYHVELESHDVLIANGVPAESYRDDGNRWLFQNANSGWDLPPQRPYAPVLIGGPVVDAVWERLLDRAGRYDLPALTDAADPHLIVDGVRVDARAQSNGAHIFRLPCHPKSVVIGSRAGVPAELGFARDPRCLGTALRRVTISQGAKFMLIDADDERLTAGFHDYEPAENIRWTDGHGELPIQAFARFDEGAKVVVYLGGSTWYPVEDHRDIATAA